MSFLGGKGIDEMGATRYSAGLRLQDYSVLNFVDDFQHVDWTILLRPCTYVDFFTKAEFRDVQGGGTGSQVVRISAVNLSLVYDVV